ncbi:Cyanovirin-N [Mycena epipterygia]|nr:Cyanovirin-N [Mycena epipterygia]
MSFSESSQNYRLEGTHLHAECRDEDGNMCNSSLNLNRVLGNDDGRFDSNGENFSESAEFYGLDGTTLVARLRSSDGEYYDARIDLNSFITNNNGKLEKA